jgi:hypothetical protein
MLVYPKISMVLDLWNKNMKEAERKKTHVGVRRFILSPDPKSLEGFSPEQKKEVIERTIDDTMKKFKEKYTQRGDRISYLSSVHLDTKATHAHIYLFPYSKNGQYLSMNADRYLNKRMKAITKKEKLRSATDITENKLDKLKVMARNSYEKELNRYRPNTISLNNKEFNKKLEIIKDKTKSKISVYQNDRRG